MAAIPQELAEDILSRLPVKSLVRSKTASKNWYSLLSQDHKFANLHLKRSSSSSNLIFFQISIGETRFQSSNIDDTNSSRKFNFPVELARPHGLRLIGSVNGLICVAPTFEGGCCFIWNPCTAECKKISVPLRTAGCRLFGFGYDSCSDDYKIVGDWGEHFQIFSLKTNSWKIFEYSLKMKDIAVHLNGVLHWSLGRKKIGAFDLGKEKFFYMEMPEEVEANIYGCAPLLDYQGSLCAYGGKSIWVMEEYGDSKSWAKLSTFVAEEHVNPVGISRLGEVVFRAHDRFEFGLVKSDIQGRISDDELKMISNWGRAFVYRESLISPKCFDGLSKKKKKRRRKRRKTNAT